MSSYGVALDVVRAEGLGEGPGGPGAPGAVAKGPLPVVVPALAVVPSPPAAHAAPVVGTSVVPSTLPSAVPPVQLPPAPSRRAGAVPGPAEPQLGSAHAHTSADDLSDTELSSSESRGSQHGPRAGAWERSRTPVGAGGAGAAARTSRAAAGQPSPLGPRGRLGAVMGGALEDVDALATAEDFARFLGIASTEVVAQGLRQSVLAARGAEDAVDIGAAVCALRSARGSDGPRTAQLRRSSARATEEGTGESVSAGGGGAGAGSSSGTPGAPAMQGRLPLVSPQKTAGRAGASASPGDQAAVGTHAPTIRGPAPGTVSKKRAQPDTDDLSTAEGGNSSGAGPGAVARPGSVPGSGPVLVAASAQAGVVVASEHKRRLMDRAPDARQLRWADDDHSKEAGSSSDQEEVVDEPLPGRPSYGAHHSASAIKGKARRPFSNEVSAFISRACARCSG
jgi:hypothetical protein